MTDPTDSPKAKGGRARAAALTPEERREIAAKAAAARWKGDLPVATHAGELQIGDMVFPCSVLSDGTRILTQTDFMKGMGMYYSGWVAQKQSQNESAAEVPHFLAFRALEPFIDRHLGDLQSKARPRSGAGQNRRGLGGSREEGPSEEAARGRLAEAGIQEIGPGFPL